MVLLCGSCGATGLSEEPEPEGEVMTYEGKEADAGFDMEVKAEELPDEVPRKQPAMKEVPQDVLGWFKVTVANIVMFAILVFLSFGFVEANIAPWLSILLSWVITSLICVAIGLISKCKGSSPWVDLSMVQYWSYQVIPCLLICAGCLIPGWEMLFEFTDYYNKFEKSCVKFPSDAANVACLQGILGTDMTVEIEVVKKAAELLHRNLFHFTRACCFVGRVSLVEVGGVLMVSVPFHLVFYASHIVTRKALLDKWEAVKQKHDQEKEWTVYSKKQVYTKQLQLKEDTDDAKVCSDVYCISNIFDSAYMVLQLLCANYLGLSWAQQTDAYTEYERAMAVGRPPTSAIHNGEFRAIMLFCMEPTRKRIWGTEPQSGDNKSILSKCSFYKETQRLFWFAAIALQALVLAFIPAFVRLFSGSPFFSGMPIKGVLAGAAIIQTISNFLLLMHLDITCYKLGMMQDALYTLRTYTKEPQMYTEYCKEECPLDDVANAINPFEIKFDSSGQGVQRLKSWYKTSKMIRVILSGLRTKIAVDLAVMVIVVVLALVFVVVGILSGGSVVQVDTNQALASTTGKDAAKAVSADVTKFSAVDASAALVVILVIKVIGQIILRIACINEEFDMQDQVLSNVCGEGKMKATAEETSDGAAYKKWKARINSARESIAQKAKHSPLTVFGKKITNTLLTTYILLAVATGMGSLEGPAASAVVKACKHIEDVVDLTASTGVQQLANQLNPTNSTNVTTGLLLSKQIARQVDKNKGVLTGVICAQLEALMPKLLAKVNSTAVSAVSRASTAAGGRRLEDQDGLFLAPQSPVVT